MTKDWDYSTDILVVGSGAGGMTTAIIAHELGAETLVVEKTKLYGGTTAVSGGNIWIPGNHLAPDNSAADSDEAALIYLKGLIGNEVSESRLQAYVETGAKLVKFLEEVSPIKFIAGSLPDYYSNMPGGKSKYRALDPLPIDSREVGTEFNCQRPPHPQTVVAGLSFTTRELAVILTKARGWLGCAVQVVLRRISDFIFKFGSRRLTLGAALVARCRLAMKDRDLPLWKETALSELIIEEDRVVGIVADTPRGTIRIQAKKAVVVAAGGFNSNSEMRKEYLPNSAQVAWSVAPPIAQGDGIRAGVCIGAQTALMDEAWWIPVYPLPVSGVTNGMFFERAFPGSLIVNQRGQRYFNEAANYDYAGRAMACAEEEKCGKAPSFFVFDARFRARYLAGPLLPMPAWLDCFFNGDQRKLVVKAMSLKELARKINIDTRSLEDTVERYNKFSNTGVDKDFQRGEETYERYYSDHKVKPNSTLAAIEKAPYYAVPIYPGDIGTKGGLLSNENAQVLDIDGKAIPGLYVTGNSAASVMGRSYPGGGATIGPSMVFGARAAMHATKSSPWD